MKTSFETITTGQAVIRPAFFSNNYVATIQVEAKGKSFLKLAKGDVRELIKALEGAPTDNQRTNGILEKLAIDCSTPGEVRMYTGNNKQIRIKKIVFLEALKQLA